MMARLKQRFDGIILVDTLLFSASKLTFTPLQK
jgi:hypothetical protein